MPPCLQASSVNVGGSPDLITQAANRLGHAALRIKLGVCRDDNHAAGRWELDNGGEYYAAGVGTGIAGFRADGALIDDLIRSREDADSQRVRDKIWDWYKSDLLTRLRVRQEAGKGRSVPSLMCGETA